MLIAVGGHSRNIGKTSVVEGIIAAVPEARWTAVKITQYGHGVCTAGGTSCDCAAEDALHPYSLDSEPGPGSDTDSGRFLRAGAHQSFWLRTATGQLGNAIVPLRSIVETNRNVILESNSVLQFLRPDLYIVVMDFAVPDMKDSARLFLNRADAFVLIDNGVTEPPWEGVPARWFAGKPKFRARPPEYVDRELTAFVRTRMAALCTR
jgi:hypothetical protein